MQRHFCQFTSNNQNTILTICHFQFFQTFDKHQSSSSLKRLRKGACPNFNSPVIQYQVRLSTILRTSDAYHLSNSSCGYVLTLLTIAVHACFFSHKTFILSMLQDDQWDKNSPFFQTLSCQYFFNVFLHIRYRKIHWHNINPVPIKYISIAPYTA